MSFKNKLIKYGPLTISSIYSYFQNYNNDFIDTLNKPKLYPPSWIFGIVWPILYYNMGKAAEKIYKGKASGYTQALFIFILQFILNLSWTPVFFKDRNYKRAYIIIVLLILTVLITIKLFNDIDPSTKKLLIPYLLWLLYAAYLNKYILDNNN